jgi:hypothetical protein
MDEEGLQQTSNKKIFIGNQIDINPATFLSQLEEVEKLAGNNDSDAVVEKLSEMVPTFNHKTNG